MKKLRNILVFALISLLLLCSFTNIRNPKYKSTNKKIVLKKIITVKKKIVKKHVPKKKACIPSKLEVVDGPADEYQPGDPVEITVKAPNTNVNVQYRMTLTAGSKASELYKNSKDNYGPYVSGKKEYGLTLRALYDSEAAKAIYFSTHNTTPGAIEEVCFPYGSLKNTLTVYVRAQGSKNKYDSKVVLTFYAGGR